MHVTSNLYYGTQTRKALPAWGCPWLNANFRLISLVPTHCCYLPPYRWRFRYRVGIGWSSERLENCLLLKKIQELKKWLKFIFNSNPSHCCFTSPTSLDTPWSIPLVENKSARHHRIRVATFTMDLLQYSGHSKSQGSSLQFYTEDWWWC